MTHSALWFKPSRIVWWPSVFDWPENRQINIDWLKWKISLFYDEGEAKPKLPKLKDVLGWSLVAVLVFLTIALWFISEGFWTR